VSVNRDSVVFVGWVSVNRDLVAFVGASLSSSMLCCDFGELGLVKSNKSVSSFSALF